MIVAGTLTNKMAPALRKVKEYIEGEGVVVTKVNVIYHVHCSYS